MRTVKSELEATLRGVAAGRHPASSGKLERKIYGDGSERLTVRLKGLDETSSAGASVIAGGRTIAEVLLSHGRGGYEAESTAPGAIPELESGQVVQVMVDGEVALEGTLSWISGGASRTSWYYPPVKGSPHRSGLTVVIRLAVPAGQSQKSAGAGASLDVNDLGPIFDATILEWR